MTECPKCSKGRKTNFGFGWVEYSCGHFESFCPTEW